jgi:MraZ protein
VGISGECNQRFMFIGEYSHNLDDKGRLAVPKKFREDLLKGAVVTRGLDNCLFLYTKVEWEKLAQKLADLPFAQANTRAFARLMLAGAMDVGLDKQGRIMLPEYLRSFAGLKKNSIVAGLYNRLEIWDQKKWEVYKKQTESQSTKIAEQMAELGV